MQSPTRRVSLLVTAAALALAAATLIPGCNRDASEARASSNPLAGNRDAGEKPVPVEVATLETGEIEAALRFSANLEAEKQVLVLSRSVGPVEKLAVEEGDEVRQDATLLRIEGAESRSQLARAQHDLAKAKRDHAQTSKLHSQGIASNQELQQATYEVERLALAVTDAQRAVRYTTVRAPIGGVVTRRFVEFGDQVSVNQQLFEVTDFDSIVARVYVPEKQLGLLSPGLEARIIAQAAGGDTHVGKVDRVAPVVDPKSGTVKVTIAIPRTPALKPGMFVNVELVTERRPEALLLPKRALVYDNDEPYAFVLEGERVSKRRVVVVLEDQTYVQPASGFEPGDKVVIAGQIGLKDKALVETTAAAAAKAEAKAAAEAAAKTAPAKTAPAKTAPANATAGQ